MQSVRRGSPGARPRRGALALLLASIPFIVNGRVGILGVGLVNDDMASHLLIADWLNTRVGETPGLIEGGYPVGPHALAAGLSEGLGTGLIEAFAGITLAIPVLTALVAVEALRDLRPLPRVIAAALVALPYLAAAYLAQGAFKEPMEALFLVAFALLLPGATTVRRALPLAVIAAGAVYAYSFPGLFWLLGAAAIYAAIALARRGAFAAGEPGGPLGHRGGVRRARGADGPGARPDRRLHELQGVPRLDHLERARKPAPPAVAARGAGDLAGERLSAFGERRHHARAGLLPRRPGGRPRPGGRAAALDTPPRLGAARGAGRGDRHLPGGTRLRHRLHERQGPRDRRPPDHPDLARRTAGPRALVGGATGSLWRSALALALAAGIALSSFPVLRQAPVAPSDHADQLADLRPLVQGHKVLFLGRDNFIAYELRGSRPFTAVRNYYDPNYVRPNLRLKDVFRKFDFDSVRPATLGRFPYVITTRAAYASGPPPAFEPLRVTADFVLWKRTGPVGERRTLAEGDRPGEPLDCSSSQGRRLRRGGGTATAFAAPPVIGGTWSPSPTVESGSASSQELTLPPGRWRISIQYDSTRALRISAPGMAATLPPNLDYRGSVPFHAAGELTVRRHGPVRFTASVERPPLAGRLLGAYSVAHLGAIAASPAAGDQSGGPLPGLGERRVRLRRACGRYLDWFRPRAAP